ncbi:MAG: SEL1-like repeat protein, partial [Pseudomonadota bacterium]|nr:SEL1-like repeat protein [Pseudomonadota bacterium]
LDQVIELGKYEAPQQPPAKIDDEDFTSQYNLGVMYLNGQGGVSRDLEMAYKMFHSAAENGHVRAQYNLASCTAPEPT